MYSVFEFMVIVKWRGGILWIKKKFGMGGNDVFID